MKRFTNKTIVILAHLCLCLTAKTYAYCPGVVSNIYLDAEFLYWQSHQDGLPYAVSGTATTTFDEGPVREVDLRWDPGFRVKGGLLLGCDWDFSIDYTWFRSHQTGAFSNSTDSFSPFSANAISSGTGDWLLRFQTLDINFTKDFCFTDGFAIALISSIKVAFIKDFFVSSSIETVAGASYDSSNFQRFTGVGPRVGLSTSWCLFPNVSLIGEANGSLLWGEYSITRMDVPGARGTAIPVNIAKHFNSLNFVPEYRLGIKWDSCLCNDQYHVSFLVAWEEQLWLHHNQMLYAPWFSLIERNTNLSLYGLTLGANLSF